MPTQEPAAPKGGGDSMADYLVPALAFVSRFSSPGRETVQQQSQWFPAGLLNEIRTWKGATYAGEGAELWW